VSFLPVFGLTGQAGRLFQPLAYTKTFVMLSAALLSVTVAPALRDYLIRGKIYSEARTRSRARSAGSTSPSCTWRCTTRRPPCSSA
jgi:Cu/Ag efflux pump CusA